MLYILLYLTVVFEIYPVIFNSWPWHISCYIEQLTLTYILLYLTVDLDIYPVILNSWPWHISCYIYKLTLTYILLYLQSGAHNQHSHSQQQNQPASGSSSFTSSDGTRQCSQPTKQPRKRAPKAKHPKHLPPVHMQTQHAQLPVHNLARSNSSDDLLSAEQLARYTV